MPRVSSTRTRQCGKDRSRACACTIFTKRPLVICNRLNRRFASHFPIRSKHNTLGNEREKRRKRKRRRRKSAFVDPDVWCLRNTALLATTSGPDPHARSLAHILIQNTCSHARSVIPRSVQSSEKVKAIAVREGSRGVGNARIISWVYSRKFLDIAGGRGRTTKATSEVDRSISLSREKGNTLSRISQLYSRV